MGGQIRGGMRQGTVMPLAMREILPALQEWMGDKTGADGYKESSERVSLIVTHSYHVLPELWRCSTPLVQRFPCQRETCFCGILEPAEPVTGMRVSAAYLQSRVGPSSIPSTRIYSHSRNCHEVQPSKISRL